MYPIIEIDHVNVRFGHVSVLRNACAKLEAGKIHGLIGRNGSGKTVLMKCICGFAAPTSGFVRVRGQVIGKDVQMPPSLGGIIETPGFLPGYSAYANLSFLAGIQNKIDKDAILDSIATVGLDPKSNKHVSKFSLGMRQRLGIAQAIMENPEILLLDEPMNGLDNSGVRDIRELLKAQRECGKTILLASHNPLDIDELCDSVFEMDGGVMTQVR